MGLTEVERLEDGIIKDGRQPVPRKRKGLSILLVVLLGLFLSLEGIGYYLSLSEKSDVKSPIDSNVQLERISERNKALKERIRSLSPKGKYIIIDTARNRLYLKENGTTLLDAVVSTGSGSVLEDPAGNRRWVFDTPRGVLTVQGKKLNPVWVKPDWAFIEEGEPIPKGFKERMEEGVLGDYGLELGNGYMIHGTLYTRLLGRNVTHGCVRVGDKDLKELYEKTSIGTKVIIF
ncbi:MAG: hypothetical protein Fur0020_08370 [Thermodesulfovibrionia bacterium]